MNARARVFRARLAQAMACACIAASVALAGSAQQVPAASTNVTVSATIASATSLSAAGCQSGVAGVTQIGTLLPGDAAITSNDCAIVFGSSNDTSMVRLYQHDGFGHALYRPASGPLDAGFSGDGIQTTSHSATHDRIVGAAYDSSGRLVVGGRMDGAVIVMRYDSSGNPDATFGGGDGIESVALNGGSSVWGGELVIQADGKIVVTGTYWGPSERDTIVLRFSANGGLDNTWAGDGIAEVVVSNLFDGGSDIALQSDGKVLVTGHYDAGGGATDGFVARLTTAGVLDTSYAGDGIANIDYGSVQDYVTSLALQPDGKAVIGGECIDPCGNPGTAWDATLARLNIDGTPDTTFGGGDGRVEFWETGNTFDDTVYDVGVQPDGRIVAAGRADGGGQERWIVWRRNSDGSADASFGGGQVVTDFGSPNEKAFGVSITAEGTVLVTGRNGATGSRDFAIARYTATGSLDTSFDQDGKATVSPGAGDDVPEAAVALPDGRVALAGYRANSGTDYDFAIAVFGATTIANWQAGTNDWTQPGAAHFAACLHTVANGASAGGASGWTVAGAGNCTTGIAANWNAIVATGATGGAKVVTGATSDTDNTANLRFGVRAALNQPPGTYVAPVVIEVIAPSA